MEGWEKDSDGKESDRRSVQEAEQGGMWKEGRKGGREEGEGRKKERRTLLVSKTSRARGRGVRKGTGGGVGWRRVDEVCLVSVPAGGILAVCEAFTDSQLHQQATGVSHIELRSCSSTEAASVLVGSQNHRLHPLSVEHTHYALIYTQRKRIREDNSIFG